MRAARLSTAEDVAGVIYEAATDGTDRLRYLVGEDMMPLINARRQMSEEAYVDFMRGLFLALSAAARMFSIFRKSPAAGLLPQASEAAMAAAG
jgi:hypothetical protein